MKELNINLIDKSYNIYIENGLINSIGDKIKNIYNGKNIVIITDENVDYFYGEKVKNNLKHSNFKVEKIVIKPGEKSKSFEVLLQVYDKMLDLGIKRGDLIIALGGGVVGDLGGFAAATFLRGVPFIQIPTSLLAQIDSSIGGKVAVDLPRGKNLIGNFYHPKAVFIDPHLLKTLDKRFLYDGMGEVIKYACIRDKNLFYKLLNMEHKEDLLYDIEEIIYTCCNIKKQVVERDEKDTGERMILNFGHTIGHSLEKYFNFEKYTHGEAVAIGMYTITKHSEDMGLTEKGTSDSIKKVLNKYNLPYEENNIDKEKIIEAISLDKKGEGDFINLVLLNNIGEVFINKVEKSNIYKYII